MLQKHERKRKEKRTEHGKKAQRKNNHRKRKHRRSAQAEAFSAEEAGDGDEHVWFCEKGAEANRRQVPNAGDRGDQLDAPAGRDPASRADGAGAREAEGEGRGRVLRLRGGERRERKIFF